MTDRELLEAAARAAGIANTGEVYALGLKLLDGPHNYWNPLANDGDALRLAVALLISVKHPDPADLGGGVVTAQLCKSKCRYLFLERTWVSVGYGNGDPHAATRRAIVRAAAALGGAA